MRTPCNKGEPGLVWPSLSSLQRNARWDRTEESMNTHSQAGGRIESLSAKSKKETQSPSRTSTGRTTGPVPKWGQEWRHRNLKLPQGQEMWLYIQSRQETAMRSAKSGILGGLWAEDKKVPTLSPYPWSREIVRKAVSLTMHGKGKAT